MAEDKALRCELHASAQASLTPKRRIRGPRAEPNSSAEKNHDRAKHRGAGLEGRQPADQVATPSLDGL
jgi:hypothetical protein